MAMFSVFWSYFGDFVGAQKIEDLTEFKYFFGEVFQITSRFLLTKKKMGLGAVQKSRMCGLCSA